MMFSWLRSLFMARGGYVSAAPESEDERADRLLNASPPQCPDCEAADFLGGPSGGAGMNVLCGTCHSEFNVAFVFNCVTLIDRLGKADAARLRFYGIEAQPHVAD